MRIVSTETFDEWRPIARQLLTLGIGPEEVRFHDRPAQRSLFDEVPSAHDAWPVAERSTVSTGVRVPKDFLGLARSVACHRDVDRFQLLYRVLWRFTTSEPHLLNIITDDDVHRLHQMEKAVRRDAHKMKAFVRFRKLMTENGERFIAWHRPDHRIVQLVAPFFARRFPAMNWAILTPDESVSWDQACLSFGPGHPRDAAPDFDELEDLQRGVFMKSATCENTIATYHPSAVLRSPQPESIRDLLIKDLLAVQARLRQLTQSTRQDAADE